MKSKLLFLFTAVLVLLFAPGWVEAQQRIINNGILRGTSTFDDGSAIFNDNVTLGDAITDVTQINGLILTNTIFTAANSNVYYFRNSLSATSGTHNVIRARAQSTAASGSTSDIRGVYAQAIANDGLFAGWVTGLYANPIAKGTSTSLGVRGILIDAETENTPTSVGNLIGAHIRNKTTVAITTDNISLLIENEKMGGGIVQDAGIVLKTTTWGADVTAWTYGIDMNQTGAFGTADIRLQNGSTIDENTAGTVAISGVVGADGGLTLPTMSTVIWCKGGSVALATSGTDQAPTNGPRQWVEIQIPYNIPVVTGIGYLVGSVGGTDSVVVELFDSAGTKVASSIATDTEIADIVGATVEFDKIAFSSTYAAVAGTYYISVQFNGTTARVRTYPIPGSPFVANTAGGTFKTAAAITPGTTFVASEGPISFIY